MAERSAHSSAETQRQNPGGLLEFCLGILRSEKNHAVRL